MGENKLLKICGILMIIGGILGIIVSAVAIVGISLLVEAAKQTGVEINEGLLMVAFVLSIIGSLVTLVAGVLGVKNAAKPENASVCIIAGIVAVAVSLIGNILTVVSGGDFNPVNLVSGLALPVLYLVGAFQSKNSMRG
jgi:hypothetical protein